MTMNQRSQLRLSASHPLRSLESNSLQNNYRPTIGSHFLLTIALLIVSNFICQSGLMIGNKIHKGRGSIADMEAQVAGENLESYWRDIRSGADFNLRSATNLVFANTIHDDNRRIRFDENWIQWCLGQFYDPLLQTQDTARIIRGHRANCSGRCQILKAIAEAAGRECRFVGLNGHVVLEVLEGTNWRVADPDYNVVYSQSLTELENPTSQNIIRRALRGRYSRQAINTYVAIFQTPDDNVRLPIGQAHSPRLNLAEQACKWMIWLTPLPLLLCGQLLLPK
jgi:hypothetical protein